MEKKIFELWVKGESKQTIADLLNETLEGITKKLTKIYRYFEVEDRTALTVKAALVGIINPKERISKLGIDEDIVFTLTEREKEILKSLCQDNGDTSDKRIANELKIDYLTVKANLTRISKKVGISGRTNLALFYLATKDKKLEERREPATVFDRKTNLTNREKEILFLLARGFTYKEIAHKLNISPRTVSVTAANARSTFLESNNIRMIIKAIKSGGLDINELTKDLDKTVIKTLSEQERKALEDLVNNRVRKIPDSLKKAGRKKGIRPVQLVTIYMSSTAV